MKKLLFLASFFFILSTNLAKAQLAYTHSTTTPLAHSTFGLSYDSYSGEYTIYLNLPTAVIGHVSYASVRTQGAVTDVTDHNEYGTSSGTFSFGGATYVYVEWALDYDDGTWETYSGYISYNQYPYGFEITGS